MKKETKKIDWDKVKNEDNNSNELKNKVSEERLSEILYQIEEGATTSDQVENIKNKEAKNEKTAEPKYEKGKLRKANLVTMIFLVLAGLIIVAELLVFIFFIFKGFINSSEGIGKIFGSKSSTGEIIGAFGYLLYYLILLAGLVLGGAAIYLTIMSVIDSAKLNFLKDQDYMMNIKITKLTTIEIPPAILADFILIFILPFLNTNNFFKNAVFINIVLAVIHLACIISFLIQAFVARIRFKRSVPISKYNEIVAEKNEIKRKFRKKRKSDGSGNLY